MDQSSNDWRTRWPSFSFVPVQHYVAAYNHGHHPESMPAFALLLNVHSKPTTWAHHIPYHTTYHSQMSNGRPDPCGSAHANARGLWRCTQMCSKCWFKKQICTQWLLKNKTNTHYTPYPMSVQKANMHAQNSSALRHRSNVLDKLKGCRQTKSIAWHNYCHNIQEGGNIFIMISLIIIIITKNK